MFFKMGSEGLGECSRRGDGDHSGDDGPGDAERPLKKARYVWQVKGKYHLKDACNNPNRSPSEPPECSPPSAGEQVENKVLENKNNNPGNDRKPNGRCCIDTLLAHADMMMASEDSSDEDGPQNIDKSLLDEIPVTLVKANPKNQDYYLRKWQARQVAKGYMDNTINRVLEICMVAPFDASDFVENCDNDGQVEDEGILMAIQSHGLQTGIPSHTRSGEGNSISFARQEIAESALDNYQNVHNELLKKRLTSAESADSFETMEMGNHTNFLDAAVAVAIQKKGLTSQNYV